MPQHLDDIIGVMIPIFALMIPIVVILTRHQQKMAELMHGQYQNQLPNAETDELRRQVSELRQLVMQQSYMLDEVRRKQELPSSTEELRAQQ
jgi:hypothetical protein